MTTDRSPSDYFLDSLTQGDNWFPSLLKTISRWVAPNEVWNGRRYRYLIGNEAFDWLLLAERLLEEAGDLIPEGEKHSLLFNGEPPIPMDSNSFRDLIGPKKYRAHLNFLYGIIVEEALQQAVLEEVAKAKQNLPPKEISLEEDAFATLYGEPRTTLYEEFLELNDDDVESASIEENHSFTYWLFRKRVKNADPSRLASDTMKGIKVFSNLNPRFWSWNQGESENGHY